MAYPAGPNGEKVAPSDEKTHILRPDQLLRARSIDAIDLGAPPPSYSASNISSAPERAIGELRIPTDPRFASHGFRRCYARELKERFSQRSAAATVGHGARSPSALRGPY